MGGGVSVLFKQLLFFFPPRRSRRENESGVSGLAALAAET